MLYAPNQAHRRRAATTADQFVIAWPYGGGFEATSDEMRRFSAMNNLRYDKVGRSFGSLTMEQTTPYFDKSGTPLDPKAQGEFKKSQGPLMEGIEKRTLAPGAGSRSTTLTKGVIVTAGIPQLRIGERITGQPPGTRSDYFVGGYIGGEHIRQTFYIEEVHQDFAEGSAYTTHLGLTRGQDTGTFVEAHTEGIKSGRVT